MREAAQIPRASGEKPYGTCRKRSLTNHNDRSLDRSGWRCPKKKDKKKGEERDEEKDLERFRKKRVGLSAHPLDLVAISDLRR